jgi:hypothetical protein
MEEVSQLASVADFAAALLVSGRLFMEQQPKTFDGLGVTTETWRAVKKVRRFPIMQWRSKRYTIRNSNRS